MQVTIDAPFPPAIVNLPTGRYVVGGSKWIKVDSDFTILDTKKLWKKPVYTTTLPNALRTFQVTNSKGNGFYQVIVSNGHASCSCTGFGFRRTCKHVDHIKKQLAT